MARPILPWGTARETAMSGVESISLDTPQETRKFPNGQAQLVTVGGSTVGRFTFEPGWRWSESVKPIVGTDRCENHHIGYALSGRMHVVDAAGDEAEIAAGEAYNIAPGHDAWIVGQEQFVGLEFKSADQYAKPK
jgi:uncharacterized cupin superfamily protein